MLAQCCDGEKKLKIGLCTSLSIALRAKVTKCAHFESYESLIAPRKFSGLN